MEQLPKQVKERPPQHVKKLFHEAQESRNPHLPHHSPLILTTRQANR